LGLETRYSLQNFDLVIWKMNIYNKEMRDRDILLSAIQKVFRKYCLEDPNIEQQVLFDVLLNALCEVMSYKGFQSWLYIAKKNIEENR